MNTGKEALDVNYQEQFLFNHLDEEIKKHSSGATLSIKQFLGMQEDHLKHIYGDLGDWEINLERYEAYAEANQASEGALVISSIDDVPELTEDDIRKWIADEENDSQLISELLQTFEKIDDQSGEEVSDQEYLKSLFHCMELLGIAPETSEDIEKFGRKPLYEWLVNHESITSEFLHNLRSRCTADRNIWGRFRVLVDIFACICTPGTAFNYDTMTIVTQQPRRFYYRGENAFYGSSKAGKFRGKALGKEQALLDVLRMDECGFFLDNFEAVLKWKKGNGTVRYGALMQHYGLKTEFMDITSDLKVALFFACCVPCEDDPEKWRPLRKDEFECADSRNGVASLGGDSRYGMLYRNRTELEYMRYFLGKKREGVHEYPFADNYKEDISGEVIPVGYQPFMRGSVQHGYTMLTDESYDMYQDSRFAKFKIRLTEDLCSWIFEEMECGNKVYPNNDIPHIQKYISRINSCRTFTEKIVKDRCQQWKLDYSAVKAFLKQRWYTVKSKAYLISQKEIDNINKAYPIEAAEQRMGVQPMMKPMIVMFGEQANTEEKDEHDEDKLASP